MDELAGIEEVLVKYTVESKKGACGGRGEPSEWRELRNISLGNRVQIVGKEFLSWSGRKTCSENKERRKVKQKGKS